MYSRTTSHCSSVSSIPTFDQHPTRPASFWAVMRRVLELLPFVRVADGHAQLWLELLAVERHLFRLHGDDGVHGDREVAGVLDIDDEATTIGGDLPDCPELLLAVGNERLEPNLDLLAHEELLS